MALLYTFNLYYTITIQTCLSQPWVHEYFKRQQDPNIDKYVIFVFTDTILLDKDQGYRGGIGDRLAGLISAFVYSQKVNRKFIIEASSDMMSIFQPYQYSNSTNMLQYHSFSSSLSAAAATSASSYSSGSVRDIRCMFHERLKNSECSLNRDYDQKVIRLHSNMATLCAASVPSKCDTMPVPPSTLFDRNKLDTNAGCILRLALWPKPDLWTALFDRFDVKSPFDMMFGAHFRCGDHSFNSSKAGGPCVKVLWKRWSGNAPKGLRSKESPIDIGRCLRSSLDSSEALQPLVYVASDNVQSAAQIKSRIRPTVSVLTSPDTCHIDHQLPGGPSCEVNNLVDWFFLTLSTKLVTQVIRSKGEVGSAKPLSGFPLSAALYSLNKGALVDGYKCKPLAYDIFLESFGTWECVDEVCAATRIG